MKIYNSGSLVSINVDVRGWICGLILLNLLKDLQLILSMLPAKIVIVYIFLARSGRVSNFNGNIARSYTNFHFHRAVRDQFMVCQLFLILGRNALKLTPPLDLSI